MKKRILVIGPKNSGKTTIIHFLEKMDQPLRHVANVVYTKEFIDVPGVYLESPWMHKHINALQQEAKEVLLLLPLKMNRKAYPPRFAKLFRKPVTGIITHWGENVTSKAIDEASQYLLEIGVIAPFIQVNLAEPKDLEKIKKEINFERRR